MKRLPEPGTYERNRQTIEHVWPRIIEISQACGNRGMTLTEIQYQAVGFYVWFERDGVPNSIWARDVDHALAKIALWPRTDATTTEVNR